MKSMRINRDWFFALGQMDPGKRANRDFGEIVQLPHDYMIAGDVYRSERRPGGSAALRVRPV